jgi:outer membrane protein TolC
MQNYIGMLLAVAVMAAGAAGEERTLTLREAVDLALKQNPDLALARLAEGKAEQGVRLARDPFIPKVAAGSGLAYSNGIPLSVAGSTPSIFQAQAVQYVFNRRQSHLISQARENARGATLDTAAKREEAAHRAATLYLEAERAAKVAQMARRQVESLTRVADVMRARVSEGRELPIEAKRADLRVAQARQRAEALDVERANAEGALTAALGLNADDRIRVTVEERPAPQLPESEQAAVSAALDNSKEVKRLESALVAKGFEIKAERAGRLPQLDLVAQYALLGKFNNYEDFFRKFQRHNGQLGVSFQIPLFAGPGVDARAAQAEGDAARLRIELQGTRNRISLDAQRLYREVRQAETTREVAKLDLDVAREQVSVLLAQMEEGRAPLRQVEEARFTEDEKWIAFVDSNYALEAARLNLLKQTGELLAALR